MSDLISREAALACFHGWVDKHGDYNAPDDIVEYQRIEALPSAKPTVETEPMWTFCDDKLPDKPGKYLTYRYNNPYGFYNVTGFADDLYKIDEYDFCDRKGKSGWYLYDSEYGYFELEVDAWMKLPEPPERRTDE